MIHIDKIDGYQIFTHNPQAKDISDAIHEILVNKNTNIKVKVNPIEQDNIEKPVSRNSMLSILTRTLRL